MIGPYDTKRKKAAAYLRPRDCVPPSVHTVRTALSVRGAYRMVDLDCFVFDKLDEAFTRRLEIHSCSQTQNRTYFSMFCFEWNAMAESGGREIAESASATSKIFGTATPTKAQRHEQPTRPQAVSTVAAALPPVPAPKGEYDNTNSATSHGQRTATPTCTQSTTNSTRTESQHQRSERSMSGNKEAHVLHTHSNSLRHIQKA